METDTIAKTIKTMAQQRAEQIDKYAMEVFGVPGWIMRRKWMLRIYAKIESLEIREHLHPQKDETKMEFYKKGKKVGEMIWVEHN